MEDMYVHQHTKVEPNWFTDGTVNGSQCMYTFSPYTNSILPQIYAFLYLNIYLYIYS